METPAIACGDLVNLGLAACNAWLHLSLKRCHECLRQAAHIRGASFAAFCVVSNCPSKQPDWLHLHCRRTTNDSDITAGGRSMFSESDMSDVYGDWVDEETQTVVKVRTAVPMAAHKPAMGSKPVV